LVKTVLITQEDSHPHRRPARYQTPHWGAGVSLRAGIRWCAGVSQRAGIDWRAGVGWRI